MAVRRVTERRLMRPVPPWVRDGAPTATERFAAKLQTDVRRDRLHSRGELGRLPAPMDVDLVVRELSGEEQARRRLSPRRNRWGEVAEFDERVARLERRQADVTAEMAAAREQLTRAQEADRLALANWVADQEGERPSSTVPAIEQRIVDLQADWDAVTLAVAHVLEEKSRFVEKQRRRLIRDAVKARRRAVERFQAAIAAAEDARTEAADCCATERWAREFPNEEASGQALRLDFTKGGRLAKAIPQLREITNASQVFAWLREDADWLGSILEDDQREQPLDPHEQPIWEDTEEGKAANRLANERVREGLKPRNVHTAGWEG